MPKTKKSRSGERGGGKMKKNYSLLVEGIKDDPCKKGYIRHSYREVTVEASSWEEAVGKAYEKGLINKGVPDESGRPRLPHERVIG
jgi:hypothetical protein